MKKYIAILLSVVFFVLVFAGCTADKTIPTKSSHTNDEFEIIIKTDNTVYKKSELSQDKPFKVIGEIKYSGTENVTIYHGDPVFVIGMDGLKTKDGADFTSAVQNTILTSTEITPGETLTFEWMGEAEYEAMGGFEKGNYTVIAFYNFTVGEDGEEVSGSFEIPLIIE